MTSATHPDSTVELDTRDGDAALFDTLLGELQRFARGTSQSLVAHVRLGGTDSVLDATATETVRGTVQAAALDLAQSGKRVNAALTLDTTPAADVTTLSHYLHSAGAASMTGNTLDLTRTVSEPRPPTDTRVIVLTGAAGAIGRAVAEHLGRSGHRLILVDIDADALEATAETTPNVTAIHACDLTSEPQVARLLTALEPTGFDAAVLLHGVPAGRALSDVDPPAARRQYAINASATTHVTTALASALSSENGGTIVALSSQAGLAAEQGNLTYCAGKFALVGFARAYAEQVRDQNVAIHVLCPGPIDSPLMRAAFAQLAPASGMSVEDYTAMRMAEIPLGRPGTTDEMAAAVQCLLDLRAATGLVLAPTGGAVMT